MSKPVLGLALALSTTALLVLAPCAAGEVFHVDQTVPFPSGGIGALKIEVGPVTLEEVIIRNMPDAGDIAKAKGDPDDNCHPKLQVGMSNSSSAKMKVILKVELLGDDGTVFMDCSRTDDVDPGGNNEHTNLCWLSSMKTIDFPKVTKIRLVASVSPG